MMMRSTQQQRDRRRAALPETARHRLLLQQQRLSDQQQKQPAPPRVRRSSSFAGMQGQSSTTSTGTLQPVGNTAARRRWTGLAQALLKHQLPHQQQERQKSPTPVSSATNTPPRRTRSRAPLRKESAVSVGSTGDPSSSVISTPQNPSLGTNTTLAQRRWTTLAELILKQQLPGQQETAQRRRFSIALGPPPSLQKSWTVDVASNDDASSSIISSPLNPLSIDGETTIAEVDSSPPGNSPPPQPFNTNKLMPPTQLSTSSYRSGTVYGDLYRPYKPEESGASAEGSAEDSFVDDVEIDQIRKTQERSQRWMYDTGHDPYSSSVGNASAWMLKFISWLFIILTFPFSLFLCLKVIKEYERAVIFRLGRLLAGGARGPGIFFVLPCIDTYRKIDLRVVSFDVPPQEILSKDSVTVSVDAVIYFRISNPVISVTKVNDAFFSTKLLAQSTLRNVLGMKTLSEMLAQRDIIANVIERILDEGTDPWGVKVERVEVKDMRLPRELMRAMAIEAEAARDARARFIAADGEQRASRALREAADVMSLSRSAITLRYLQTLKYVSGSKSHTVVVPFPATVIRALQQRVRKAPATKTPKLMAV